jgi:hypothetical protein
VDAERQKEKKMKNRCKLTDGGKFKCEVDWNTENGRNLCEFQAQDTVPVDCDFLFMATRSCSCHMANVEAARYAANASLEKYRESTDAVLDALNRLAFLVFFVLQEGRKDPDSGDIEG